MIADIAHITGPITRPLFAKLVHAEAHAIVALQDLRRELNKDIPRAALHSYLDAQIARRCIRLGLEPDMLSDAIEAAQDELAIEGLGGVGA